MRMSTIYPAMLGVICAFAASMHAHDTASAQIGSQSSPPNYAATMSRLQEASQRLREAIQEIAREPGGSRRNAAVEQAHAALFDTQQAMIMLPPELRAGTGRDATDYSRSVNHLQLAARKLRDAILAMALQPSGERRKDAAERTREALLETQQAIIWLPSALRREAGDNGGTPNTADAK